MYKLTKRSRFIDRLSHSGLKRYSQWLGLGLIMLGCGISALGDRVITDQRGWYVLFFDLAIASLLFGADLLIWSWPVRDKFVQRLKDALIIFCAVICVLIIASSLAVVL